MYWLIGCNCRKVKDAKKGWSDGGLSDSLELLNDETLETVKVSFKEFMELGNSMQVVGYTGVISSGGKRRLAEIGGTIGFNPANAREIEHFPNHMYGVGNQCSKHVPILIYDGTYVVTWNRTRYTEQQFEKVGGKLKQKMFYTFKRCIIGDKMHIIVIWLDVESRACRDLDVSVIERTGYNTVNASVAKLASTICTRQDISNIKKKQKMIGVEAFDMGEIDGLVHLTGADGRSIETSGDVRVPTMVNVIDNRAIMQADRVFIPESVTRIMGIRASVIYGLKYSQLAVKRSFNRADRNNDWSQVECKIGELEEKGSRTYVMPDKTECATGALGGIDVDNVLYQYPRKAYADTNWTGNKHVKIVGIVNNKPFAISMGQFSDMSSLEHIMIKGSGYIEALRERALSNSSKLNIGELDLRRCSSFGSSCMFVGFNSKKTTIINVDVATVLSVNAFDGNNLEVHLRNKVYFTGRFLVKDKEAEKAYKMGLTKEEPRTVYETKTVEIKEDTPEEDLKLFAEYLCRSGQCAVYMRASSRLVDRLNTLAKDGDSDGLYSMLKRESTVMFYVEK